MSGVKQSMKAGQTQGQSQAKTEDWINSAKNAANSAAEHAPSGAQPGGDSGQQQQCRDHNSGFLQQTGEQMVNMAQGAIDGVKNTLGVGSGQADQQKK